MASRPPLFLLRAAIPWLAMPALLASSLAAAQVANVTLTVNGSSTAIVPKDSCAVSITVNWSHAITGGSCQDLVLWVTRGTCGDAPGAEDHTIGTVPAATWSAQTTGSFTFPVTELPAFNTSACPIDNVDVPHRVCSYAKYNTATTGMVCSTTADVRTSQPPTITYDSQAPVPPTNIEVTDLDGALQVDFSAASDAEVALLVYRERDDPTAGFRRGSNGVARNGSLRQDGLTNGVTYEVSIQVEDLAGNLSLRSASAFGTPEPSYGFFATYQKANGAERGGCAAAPAGVLPWLALGSVGAWIARRRRQGRRGARSLAAAALALAALLPATASAQGDSSAPSRPPGEIGSERTLGLELKLGAFTPMIDNEEGLSGSRPYRTIFGDNPMLLFEVSGERQIFQAFGTAGIGISAGYAEKFAYALKEDEITRAPESTGLRLFPIQAFGVYRFDYAAHTWNIPVVPYVKAGINLTVWSSTKGASLEPTRNGGRAIGSRWGWGFTGGLALLLDVFEPRMARDFDTDAGVNHSYLFAEFNYADVSNFYQAGLDLSGRYAMFGVAFEI